MAWSAQALVQPRVALERWVNPWVTVGAMVGSSALARGEVTFGVVVSGHARAFDAAR